jgi:arginine-tRNA-protein transferase
MDLNFRRNGTILYRPQCDACDECRAIRVPVDAFRLSRSQNRCRVRNADVTVDVGVPAPTEEKYVVYQRYLLERHDGAMDGSLSEFHGFLYESCVTTIEVTYRVGGRVVAVGIADAEPEALSAVYCYFDPADASRSLGTFNILWMIDECRRRLLPHLYLGYYVHDCQKMNYKSAFRPCELLDPNGSWVSRATGVTGP